MGVLHSNNDNENYQFFIIVKQYFILNLQVVYIYVTHLHETSRMSAEFVFRYGPKCMGGQGSTLTLKSWRPWGSQHIISRSPK